MMPYLSEKRFVALSKLYILIFCLSYGRSAIEHGFSVNKEYIVENQVESSLVSLRIVHDHLKSKNVTATNIVYTADMLKSVRAS